MIKGIFSMILGALITTLIIIGLIYLFFSGLLFWIAGAIAVTFIIAVFIFLVVVFLFMILIFFVLFYFIAEKKPTYQEGNYTLDMEKGKHEK